MFELEGYTMPDFPVRDEGQYPVAMVSLDSSGGCAYLTFADKAGYIIKLIAGDVWTGNAYTLGLTPEDTYDESKVIYEQSYVVMLDEAYKDALELLYPGITTTAWLRYTPPSTQTPSGGYYSLAMNYGPQWTNTDLYDEDGNLFLSAAGKKFPLREWLSWRIYGLCSRPLPMGAREPVAYLYNGVRLPDINTVWTDKETYPYALIWDFSEPTGTDGAYMLFLSEKALTVSDGVLGAFGCRVASTLTVVGHSEWPQLEEKDNTGTNHGAGYWITIPGIWTNHDILLADGTLYLAASDPVPVYE